MNLIEFVLGLIVGGCIALWVLEFHRDLDAKLSDIDEKAIALHDTFHPPGHWG